MEHIDRRLDTGLGIHSSDNSSHCELLGVYMLLTPSKRGRGAKQFTVQIVSKTVNKDVKMQVAKEPLSFTNFVSE